MEMGNRWLGKYKTAFRYEYVLMIAMQYISYPRSDSKGMIIHKHSYPSANINPSSVLFVYQLQGKMPVKRTCSCDRVYITAYAIGCWG